MNLDDQRLLLRIPEAAEVLGIGRSTLYELMATGEIPVVRIGRAVRIPRIAIADWVDSQFESAQADNSSRGNMRGQQ